jgi:hypothetical protein
MKATIIKGVVSVLTLSALSAAWTVAASAIFCKMDEQWPAFVFPWNQWWIVRSWFGLNWWATLCVVTSAAIPTLAVLAIGAVAVRLWWRKPPVAAVYGKTAFATQPHMQANGLSTSKSPF